MLPGLGVLSARLRNPAQCIASLFAVAADGDVT
jgi:hypothetical protein